jgi:glycosyltransferase involved in cell wall biosynthesis
LATVLVIVPDAISAIVAKGEFTPRYYNPGNLFDEVHILMTNNDQVNPEGLQFTVGNAKLFLHNLPDPDWKKTFAYHPSLLKFWAKPAVKLAETVNPSLIRCYGNWLNGFLASEIKKRLGVPYVVSLHTNPDVDIRGRLTGAWEIKYWKAMRRIEKIAVLGADIVLPVYKSIIPYLESLGIEKLEVAYNVLNPEFIRKKEDYSLHSPIRLISVGRHFQEKNPENIIKALKKLPDAHLTLVGDGPHQGYLERLVRHCDLERRIEFHRTLTNAEVCQRLPNFDIFVAHVQSYGIAKSVLEALLTGLPVVINRRMGEPVPELQGDHVLLVENSVDGYFNALSRLMQDHEFRTGLGKRAYKHAQENWAPSKTEAKYVEIYKRIIGSSS